MSEQSKIEERRQRAYEAFHDDMESRSGHGIVDAIETATRVKIDDDVIKIHRLAWLEAYNELLIECVEHGMQRCPLHFSIIDVQKAALTATLAELGFEVES